MTYTDKAKEFLKDKKSTYQEYTFGVQDFAAFLDDREKEKPLSTDRPIDAGDIIGALQRLDRSTFAAPCPHCGKDVCHEPREKVPTKCVHGVSLTAHCEECWKTQPKPQEPVVEELEPTTGVRDGTVTTTYTLMDAYEKINELVRIVKRISHEN